MQQCKCGEEIAAARYALGHKLCLRCGEAEAAVEIAAKSKRTAVAYNKGPIQYMGAPEVAKSNLIGTMAAQGRTVVNIVDLPDQPTVQVSVSVKAAAVKKQIPKPIGLLYIGTQAYSVYSRDDPRLAKATRYAFYD